MITTWLSVIQQLSGLRVAGCRFNPGVGHTKDYNNVGLVAVERYGNLVDRTEHVRFLQCSLFVQMRFLTAQSK